MVPGGFEHVHHAPTVPPLYSGRETTRHPVLIAGGGPVGMAVALGLARRGVRSVVIEADDTVCIGSRAICLSRRTLEILDRLGAVQPFLETGLPWIGGRSYYRGMEVLHFLMPHDSDQRLAPMTNLQQYYIEQFLLDAVQTHSDCIEIRWATRVETVTRHDDRVIVGLQGGGTSYETEADYVVACDGARSAVRQCLGLRMAGTSYEGRYVIADIEIDLDLPTERLAWFDPPSAPRLTLLMHRQPDNLWRIDYQLAADEDPDEMIRPERVRPIVEAHLRMLGVTQSWRMIWISMYRAAAVSMERYRHGRVMFAGDAAHLVPIFGVRGLNGGFDDAYNLAWKVAYAIKGYAGAGLLDSYSEERRYGWETNIANAMKSTEFMTPPSRGFDLMREAALSLAVNHPAFRSLINPRQSAMITYARSALNTPERDSGPFAAGPICGQPVPELPLLDRDGHVRFLTTALSDDFTLLHFDGDGPPGTWLSALAASPPAGPSLRVLCVKSAGSAGAPHATIQVLEDHRGRFAALFNAVAGTAYLVRPDGHVCGRWRQASREGVEAAMSIATGAPGP